VPSDISKLSVQLVANSSGFAAGLKQGDTALNSLGATAQRVGGILSGLPAILGGIGIGFSLWSGFAKAGEIEQGVATLNAVVRSTGQAAGFTSEQLQKMSSDLAAVTTFSKGAVTQGAAILATFTNIRGDQFKEALTAAANLSTVLKQDLHSSIIQIGKALNDPTQGFTALRRAGVSFTQAQVDQIKTLQASGDILGAQKVILGELSHEFGGAAEAAGGTFSNQIAKAQASVQSIATVVAEGMLPTLAALGKLLKSGADFAKAHSDGLHALGKGILVVIGAVVAYKTAMFAITAAQKAWNLIQTITLALQGPKGWAQLAGAALAAAVAYGVVNKAQEGVNSALQEASAGIDQARQQMAGLNEDGEAGAEGLGKTAAAAKQAARDAANLQKSLADTTRNMEEQILLFGLSQHQAEAYRLVLRGLSGEQVDYAIALADQLDKLEENKKAFDEMTRAAEKFVEDSKTPLEKVSDELEKIDELFVNGFLDAAEAAKAAEKITGDFAKAREREEKKTREREVTSKAVTLPPATERRFTQGFPALALQDAQKKQLAETILTRVASEKTAKNTEKALLVQDQVVSIPL
jgi:hypothetical protein